MTWIVSLTHDEQQNTLEIAFTRDPEALVVYGTLTFTAVRNFQSVLDDDDDEYKADFEAGTLVENLFGIHEMGNEVNPNYFIKTHFREISFNTADAPNWQVVQENPSTML